MYRIYKLSHYLGTRLVKTVVILARYSVYTNQYDFMEKIVTIENFIFLRLKSHFCDENHFRRKSHFCDESHFRPFYPFLRRKSQTVSTKVFATKVLAPKNFLVYKVKSGVGRKIWPFKLLTLALYVVVLDKNIFSS